jgi:cytoskeletal protein RodZ
MPTCTCPDLSALRQRRGISLHEIADFTKISIRFLRAIEAGEFGQLPGGIYDINYIRQYARAIGYDAGPILEYYRSTARIL